MGNEREIVGKRRRGESEIDVRGLRLKSIER